MSDNTNQSVIEAYLEGLPKTEVEIVTDPDTEVEKVEVVPEKPTEDTTEEVSTESTTAPIETTTPVEKAKPWEPEFKSDKDRFVYDKIVSGDEEELYKILSDKYAYKSMSDENKLMAYLAIQNPGLDDDDLAFEAAQQFGVGVTPLDEDELDEQAKTALKQQSIQRKKTLNQANAYFQEKANKTELPSLPSPVDADPEYKSWKEQTVKQKEEQTKINEQISRVNAEIDSTAPSIKAIETEVKINIDESELSFNINFNLDNKKQKQLAQFAKEYTPTQEEYSAFEDQSGKFDMKGYMQSLTEKLFHKQITAAAIKQAITQDRERFVEGTLKNSTLRNNDVNNEVTNEPADMYEAYWSTRK